MGYSGSASRSSTADNPVVTYQNILDYAESIRVTFDPTQISYQDMITLFFELHTPADPRWAGTQYRSAIFVHTSQQRELAHKALATKGALARYVAIEDASDFFRAEEYHQKYIEKAMAGRY